MRPLSIDPSPRSYASTVSIMRRAAIEPADLPPGQTLAELETWLLGPATREEDTLSLVMAFCGRLAAMGDGISRLTLHVGTLHPQAIGFAWHWDLEDGICDELRASLAAAQHESFRRTPLYRVIQQGERFQGDPQDASLVATYPFLGELGRLGLTDYVAFPIGEGQNGRHNAITVATRRPGGFGSLTPDETEGLRRPFRLFALHMHRHVARRISLNIVQTYLGHEPGRRVLDGSIQRGAGESGDAVIWMSDLRGFTDLSERLAPQDVLTVLDAYFDIMAEAVMAAGGEVMKFIGDGMLAGFGVLPFGSRKAAAEAALAAARRALADLAQLNAAPTGRLAEIAGWHPLRTGIGLHEGEVFFGNVGSPERLDFTVIGRAVNVASRVEGLCRPLARSVLMTDRVAADVDEPLDDLGEHALKGVSEPIRICGLRERPALSADGRPPVVHLVRE